MEENEITILRTANALYKSNKCRDALEMYMRISNKNHIILGNISACQNKLGEYEEALVSANQSQLLVENLKAINQIVIALRGLKKYSDALNIINSRLQDDPTNKFFLNLKQKCEKGDSYSEELTYFNFSQSLLSHSHSHDHNITEHNHNYTSNTPGHNHSTVEHNHNNIIPHTHNHNHSTVEHNHNNIIPHTHTHNIVEHNHNNIIPHTHTHNIIEHNHNNIIPHTHTHNHSIVE